MWNILFDFSLLIAVYFICFFRKWKSKGMRMFILNTVIYIYVSCILYFTLMPFVLPMPGKNRLFLNSMNLILFVDLTHHRSGALVQIILNVMLFIPLGFLLAVKKQRNLAIVVLQSFLLSLSIETTQLLYVWSASVVYRVFDITDLITNTLGGSIGVLVFILLKKYVVRNREF